MIEQIKTVLSAILALVFGLYQSVGFVPVPVKPVFTAHPAVFEAGDSYAVAWATSVKGTGYLTYTYDGKEYTVYDAASGNIKTDDTVHVVKVKKEHLDGNAYQVHSQSVLFKFGYTAFKGATVSSEAISFRGYSGQDEIEIVSISDIHGETKKMKSAYAALDADQADLLVLNGDITNTSLSFQTQLVKDILGNAAFLSKGEYPVVYVRGNHETRGEFAARLKDYFPTDTNELYFTFRYGPISAVVLDSGEDKADDHYEYSGLVDFESYRQQELDWLKGLERDASEGVQYRLALSHDPHLADHFGENWSAELGRIGTQLLISGHTHSLSLQEKDLTNPLSFITFVDGGNGNDFIVSKILLKGSSARFYAVDHNGEVQMDRTLPLA